MPGLAWMDRLEYLIERRSQTSPVGWDFDWLKGIHESGKFKRKSWRGLDIYIIY